MQNRLKEDYDWIVVGDHPSALLCGGLVARLGLSVLFLDVDESVSIKTGSGGQIWDGESNYFLGLGKTEQTVGLLHRCLARMSWLPIEEAKVSDQSSSPQILTPTHRILTHQSLEQTYTEFLKRNQKRNREMSKSTFLSGALKRASHQTHEEWTQIPDRLTFQRNKTEEEKKEKSKYLFPKKLITQKKRSLPRLEVTEELLDGLTFGLHGRSYPITQFSFLESLVLGQTGAAIEGGAQGLRELLRRLAKRLGAHIPDEVKCRRIFVNGNRIQGVQISSGSRVIGCRGLGLGIGLDQAEKMTDGLKWRTQDRIEPVGWRFTLALNVRKEGLPPGCSRRMIWKESGAPAIEIEIAHPTEYGITDRDQIYIFARTIVPFKNETLELGYQKLLAARVFKQLTEIFPFLEYHLVNLYPDFRGGADDEFKQVYGFESLKVIPEFLRVNHGVGMGSQLLAEGFFVNTSEAYPHYGFMGALKAAIESTAWIAHKNSLSGPLA